MIRITWTLEEPDVIKSELAQSTKWSRMQLTEKGYLHYIMFQTIVFLSLIWTKRLNDRDSYWWFWFWDYIVWSITRSWNRIIRFQCKCRCSISISRGLKKWIFLNHEHLGVLGLSNITGPVSRTCIFRNFWIWSRHSRFSRGSCWQSTSVIPIRGLLFITGWCVVFFMNINKSVLCNKLFRILGELCNGHRVTKER